MPRDARHVVVIGLAVAAILVSSPLRRLAAQGSSAGQDLLYLLNLGKLYTMVPDVSGATYAVDLVQDGCTVPGSNAGFDVAPDGTFYGFATDCLSPNKLHWARLDPDTGVVTLTVPQTRSSMTPTFVTAFGAPGTPLGYRFNTAANLKTPVDVYAVDALSPYAEHLLYSNIGDPLGNVGIGTVVTPDGRLEYVAVNAVYPQPLPGASNTAMSPLQFLTFFGLEFSTVVANYDHTGVSMFIFDGPKAITLQPDPDHAFVRNLLTIQQVNSAVMRRTPWGGVRIEPHHGLVTTRNSGTATFTAVLTAQPTASVTMNLSSSNADAGVVNPASVTFTTANWNVPQAITVTGVNDGGGRDVPYTIVTSGTSSADPNYVGKVVLDVNVTNTNTFVSPPVPAPSPPAFPPAISGIGTQSIPIGGSLRAGFTVTSTLVPAALRVSASAADPALVPSLAMSCGGLSSCTLTLTAADGRSGTTTVTVSASDGFYVATSSFTLVVGSGVTISSPGQAQRPAAVQSGSGAVLTWSRPADGSPQRYAIVMGTHSGFFDLPTVLTFDASPSYSIPSLPPGTYFFRIYALTEAGLGPGSDEASFTIANPATVPGPPRGLMGLLTGSTATLAWMPPIFGGAPSAYSVERGASPGQADVTTVVTGLSHSVALESGTHWFRVRAISGGATSAASNDLSVPLDGTCAAAPGMPVLLPVHKVNGQAVLSWQPGPGASAARYRIEIGDGRTVTTLTTPGAGSSFVWAMPPGSFSARITADNDCGSSHTSNAMSF